VGPEAEAGQAGRGWVRNSERGREAGCRHACRNDNKMAFVIF
jgi:hypothetical protein